MVSHVFPISLRTKGINIPTHNHKMVAFCVEVMVAIRKQAWAWV